MVLFDANALKINPALSRFSGPSNPEVRTVAPGAAFGDPAPSQPVSSAQANSEKTMNRRIREHS
jgi:hypothetical protein